MGKVFTYIFFLLDETQQFIAVYWKPFNESLQTNYISKIFAFESEMQEVYQI